MDSIDLNTFVEPITVDILLNCTDALLDVMRHIDLILIRV